MKVTLSDPDKYCVLVQLVKVTLSDPDEYCVLVQLVQVTLSDPDKYCFLVQLGESPFQGLTSTVFWSRWANHPFRP